MKVIKLLEFLNNVKIMSTLNCASCVDINFNILDLLSEEEQFVQKIDLGLVFIKESTLQNVVLVDGIQRVLSVSLLLHAICECYKKTSPKNDRAIKFIRANYLFSGENLKLRLPENEQIIYQKIINGERLSGKEKKTQMFILLHSMWTKIKQEQLQAANILKMLEKIVITTVEIENAVLRDLYIALNKEKRNLNQFLLIEDYLANLDLLKEWKSIKSVFGNNEQDLTMFFKDFFVTKFNFNEFSKQKLYEYFINYFETMLVYMPKNEILYKIKNMAKLYDDIVNVNFTDEELKRVFIKVKMHKGEDTYAYLLNVYQDYIDSNITKATFIEILLTIDDYLQNRLKTPNDVSFNELIKYLNAFITCK